MYYAIGSHCNLRALNLLIALRWGGFRLKNYKKRISPTLFMLFAYSYQQSVKLICPPPERKLLTAPRQQLLLPPSLEQLLLEAAEGIKLISFSERKLITIPKRYLLTAN